MTQIIPTLLATTEEKYREDLDKVLSVPDLSNGWVQIDFMDNKFVQNLSVGLDIIEKYPFKAQKEAQLMVADPINWIEKLAQLGFQRILFHIETGNTQEVIDRIKSLDVQVGLCINPETPVDKLLPFMGILDAVLVMGVHPGYQGQSFIPETLEKIKEVSRLRSRNNLKFVIEVDGGVSPENAKALVRSGADILAVGSKLFNGTIAQNLEKFKEVLNQS